MQVGGEQSGVDTVAERVDVRVKQMQAAQLRRPAEARHGADLPAPQDVGIKRRGKAVVPGVQRVVEQPLEDAVPAGQDIYGPILSVPDEARLPRKGKRAFAPAQPVQLVRAGVGTQKISRQLPLLRRP